MGSIVTTQVNNHHYPPFNDNGAAGANFTIGSRSVSRENSNEDRSNEANALILTQNEVFHHHQVAENVNHGTVSTVDQGRSLLLNEVPAASQESLTQHQMRSMLDRTDKLYD